MMWSIFIRWYLLGSLFSAWGLIEVLMMFLHLVGPDPQHLPVVFKLLELNSILNPEKNCFLLSQPYICAAQLSAKDAWRTLILPPTQCSSPATSDDPNSNLFSAGLTCPSWSPGSCAAHRKSARGHMGLSFELHSVQDQRFVPLLSAFAQWLAQSAQKFTLSK